VVEAVLKRMAQDVRINAARITPNLTKRLAFSSEIALFFLTVEWVERSSNVYMLTTELVHVNENVSHRKITYSYQLLLMLFTPKAFSL